mgnify:CR=1 FL=1
MELVCEKYKERMDSEKAHCRHPQEYCKFRTSCLIHFLAGENKEKDGQRPDEGKEEEAD